MLCLHFGPGQLGLGLIVERVTAAGFRVCLIGRPGRDEPERYGVNFTDPQRGLSYAEVPWADGYAEVGDLPAEVLSAVRESDHLLITCALENAIAQRVDFIVELVGLRPPGAETVLLACENDPAEGYKEIARRFGDRIRMPPVVVDRICSWAKPARDASGQRVVVVHPTGEWLIGDDGTPSKVLDQLCSVDIVTRVPLPIDGWKKRKLWSVNGIHIILGLVARLVPTNDLPLSDEHAQRFVEQARPLIEQIATGVHARWPEVPVDAGYVADRIDAFCESPDTTWRLLSKYLVRHDLCSFMDRLSARLGDAARMAHAAGADCAPFREAIALVESALANPAVYYPPAEPTPLSEQIDDEVVSRYAAVLDTWMDADQIRTHCAFLKRTLAAQRAEQAPPIPIDD